MNGSICSVDWRMRQGDFSSKEFVAIHWLSQDYNQGHQICIVTVQTVSYHPQYAKLSTMVPPLGALASPFMPPDLSMRGLDCVNSPVLSRISGLCTSAPMQDYLVPYMIGPIELAMSLYSCQSICPSQLLCGPCILMPHFTGEGMKSLRNQNKLVKEGHKLCY